MSKVDIQAQKDSGAEYNCPWDDCPRTFTTESGMKVHHNRIHGESISGVATSCDWCGETVRKSQRVLERTEHTFCDRECFGKWESETLVGKNHPKRSRIEVECENCGSSIQQYPHRVEKQDHHFCDASCRGDWIAKTRPEWSLKDDELNGVFECEWCGGEFTRLYSQVVNAERQFCTQKCYEEWFAQNRSGEGSPNWNGGPVLYGLGWNPKKRRNIRERDNHTCQSCGMSSREHHELHGEKLHVHHIQKARSVDDPATRNAPKNLVTLCRDCHYRWEKMSPLRPQ